MTLVVGGDILIILRNPEQPVQLALVNSCILSSAYDDVHGKEITKLSPRLEGDGETLVLGLAQPHLSDLSTPDLYSSGSPLKMSSLWKKRWMIPSCYLQSCKASWT